MAEQPRPEWFKSSYSGSLNNECLECAHMPQGVLVRDSKDSDGPRFAFPRRAWGDFTTAIRADSLFLR